MQFLAAAATACKAASQVHDKTVSSSAPGSRNKAHSLLFIEDRSVLYAANTYTSRIDSVAGTHFGVVVSHTERGGSQE
eukprot:1161736-Pelagomonas_calceolata.AAC.8